MALAFNKTAGGAQKNRADAFEMKNGENKVRMFGGLTARYVYWIKGENNKNIPFECLEFNRETEKFDKAEKDWVKEFYPDQKCSWAYAVLVIDPADGKVKIWNLKKKLLEQILSAAEDLGDPTDPDTGWDVVFEKKKTGPLPINVGYELKVLRCKSRPLDDAELAAVAEAKSIDEMLPRPTPDAQKELLEKLRNGATGEGIDEEIGDEFKAQ
jgi:hypothetical protein